MDKIYNVAKIINTMSYLELKEIASDLVDRVTNGDYNYDLKTNFGWIELLSFWAEYVVDDKEEAYFNYTKRVIGKPE